MSLKTKFIAVVFVTGISVSLLNSCYYDNAEYLLSGSVCDTTSVSFATDVLPILDASCNICHSIENSASIGGGYIFENYDELTASTNGETLIDVIDWLPGGPSDMPKSGSQLPSCERSVIRAWVNQGLLNN